MADIGEYINTYNKERLHSAIGDKTPDEVYFNWLNNKNKNHQNSLQKVS